MWIVLTDVNGDRVTINFNHVVSYNPYGTGAHIVTINADLAFFVRETVEEIQNKLGIEVDG